MPLPVLPSSAAVSSGDLLRFFQRTELDWSRQIAEAEEALPCGTALAAPEKPNIVQANAVLEAAVPPGALPAQVVDEAEHWFANRRVECRRWVLNPTAGSAANREGLANELIARGYKQQETPVLRLGEARVPNQSALPGITIIPGRASYSHILDLAAQQAREAGIDVDQSVRAMTGHLDDPAVHVIMALAANGGTEPVGFATVLPGGQVGRIVDWFVVPASRRRGVGSALLIAALDFCARAMFKHVLAACSTNATAGRHLLERVGFADFARFVEFVR